MAWFNGILDWFGSSNPYDAGNATRHRPTRAGRVSHAQDEDSAVKPYGREQLRLECRDIRRNNPVGKSICDRLVSCVGGREIIPQAKTSDNEWNRKAEKFFGNYSKVCDYRRRIVLKDFIDLIINSSLTDGELGIVLMKNGQIAPVEAERIRTPTNMTVGAGAGYRIVDGVMVANSGQKMRYYVHNRNEAGFFDGNSFTAYESDQFWHILRAGFRADMVRAVPDLASIVNPVKDIERYKTSLVLKAENEAKDFYIVKNQAGAVPVSQNPRKYGLNADGTGTAPTVNGSPVENISTGEIKYLKTGEDLERIGSNTPSSNAIPFIQGNLRIICPAIGLPYEVAMMDFSRSNYSVSRTALLQLRDTVESWQFYIVNQFLQRLWNWRIAKAIKDGDLPQAPTDEDGISEWYKVVWQTPRLPSADPMKDAQSTMLEITAGVNTNTEWAMKRGRDLEDVMTEKQNDIMLAHIHADAVRQKYPNSGVTWRDFIHTAMSGQVLKDEPPESVDLTTDGEDDGEDDNTGEGLDKWLT